MNLLTHSPRAAMLLSAGITLAAAAAWRALAVPSHGQLACLNAQESHLRDDLKQRDQRSHPDEEFLARDLARLRAQHARLERFREPMAEDELLGSLQYLAQRHHVVIDRADFQPQQPESPSPSPARNEPHATPTPASPQTQSGPALALSRVSTVTLSLRGEPDGMDKFLRALQVASRCRVDALQPTSPDPGADGTITAQAIVSHWRMVGDVGASNSPPEPTRPFSIER